MGFIVTISYVSTFYSTLISSIHKCNEFKRDLLWWCCNDMKSYSVSRFYLLDVMLDGIYRLIFSPHEQKDSVIVFTLHYVPIMSEIVRCCWFKQPLLLRAPHFEMVVKIGPDSMQSYRYLISLQRKRIFLFTNMSNGTANNFY